MRASRGVLLAFTLLAARSGAQSATPGAADTASVPRYRYRILGVLDERTGAPIEDVDVVEILSGNSVRTTSTGTVSLLFLPDGGALIRIQKIGYQLQTMMASISAADTNPMTLVMKRVVELPAVVTIDSATHNASPGLRNFEERRRNHDAAYFISEAQIRKEGDRPLATTLAAHFPGVQVREGRHGVMVLQRSTHCWVGGPPDVFLDGVLLPHPTDLSEMALGGLAGVEYYPTNAGAPAQFGGTTTACGSLLLWSRQ